MVADEDSDHPRNVYPLLVGVPDGRETVKVFGNVEDGTGVPTTGDGAPLPPFALNITLTDNVDINQPSLEIGIDIGAIQNRQPKSASSHRESQRIRHGA